jgi:hypothetical protein
LPTDNEFGIPLLRLDRQGSIIYPVTQWGSISRRSKMPGIWSFYCDDYRFGALLANPLRLSPTDCKCSCEINLSLFDQHPAVYAYWCTYRKRSSARQWQDVGIGVLVDLCVPARFFDVNLIGVPKGWTAYCTRGFAGREDELAMECEVARKHGGADATVMVYGGGKRVREACQSLPSAIYVEQIAESRHHG